MRGIIEYVFKKNTFNCQLIPGTKSQLGESPIWCEFSNSLLWVDIKKGKLYRLYKNNTLDIKNIPLLTSAVLLTERKEIFMLVNIKGLYLIDYNKKEIILYHSFNFNNHRIRTNESQISPFGTLYFSIMDKSVKSPIGTIYEFNSSTKEHKEIRSGLLIPNTMKWFENSFWFADSADKCFFKQDIKTKKIKKYHMKYIVDGSALTKNGILVNACWGAGKIVFYDLNKSMKIVDEILISPTQPTSCVFAGNNLSTLYITSAYDNLLSPKFSDGMITKVNTEYSGQHSQAFIF